MFIWDDGDSVTVTGSVDHTVLDAYNKAKDAGEDLSPFAQYMGVPPETQVDVSESAPEFSGQTNPTLADVEAAHPVVDEGDYDGWSLAELQAEAEARGVAKSGNKADVAERLRQYDDDNADQEV